MMHEGCHNNSTVNDESSDAQTRKRGGCALLWRALVCRVCFLLAVDGPCRKSSSKTLIQIGRRCPPSPHMFMVWNLSNDPLTEYFV